MVTNGIKVANQPMSMWGNYPVLYRQENSQKVLKWGRGRQNSQNQQESIADFEDGRRPQVKECRQLLAAGKAGSRSSLQKGRQPHK